MRSCTSLILEDLSPAEEGKTDSRAALEYIGAPTVILHSH